MQCYGAYNENMMIGISWSTEQWLEMADLALFHYEPLKL